MGIEEFFEKLLAISLISFNSSLPGIPCCPGVCTAGDSGRTGVPGSEKYFFPDAPPVEVTDVVWDTLTFPNFGVVAELTDADE